MYGFINGCIYLLMEGYHYHWCMDLLIDGLIYSWMGGFFDICIDKFMNV